MLEIYAGLLACGFTLACLTISQTRLRKEVHTMALDFSRLQTAASNAISALQGEDARTKAAVDSAVSVAVDAAVAAEKVTQANAEAADQATINALADSLSAPPVVAP